MTTESKPETSVIRAVRAVYQNAVIGALKKVKGLESIEGDNKQRMLCVVAGNIAINGTSSETIYPNVVLGVYGDKSKLCEFRLDEAVQAVKDLVGTFTAQSLNPTFRNLMEPFAREAMLFLAAAKARGEISNLASKMTKTCGRAPEVAFDFNSGLNINQLSNTQKAVIQRLNERLFSTESEKAKLENFLDQGDVAAV